MRKSFVIIRLIGGPKDGDFVYLQGSPDFYFADQSATRQNDGTILLKCLQYMRIANSKVYEFDGEKELAFDPRTEGYGL